MKSDSKANTKVYYFHNMQNSDVYKLENNFVLGRDASADIQLSDESVSSVHLKILLKNSHIFIVDLQSSNGTKVNSINIAANDEVRLRVGDNLALGNISLQLSRKSKSLTGESNFSLITSKEELFNSSNYKKAESEVDILITGIDKSCASPSMNESELMDDYLKKMLSRERELVQKVERLHSKHDQKIYLENQIEKFDKDYANITERSVELEDFKKKNSNRYKELSEEVSKVEAKLTLLKMAQKQISNNFEELIELKNLEKKRSRFIIELKELNRDKIDDQLSVTKTKLRKIRRGIEDQRVEIENLRRKELIQKEKESKDIAKNIKKLKEKLGNAS